MLLTDRHVAEQRFHDSQAAERADRWTDLADLRFPDAEYLDHAPWIRPAFDLLGNIDGKRVLDYGCGHGMASVVLARRGAIVRGIDLSAGYVDEARRRALVNDTPAEFLQADAERLPFPDDSFDAIWGCAILHHLDLRRAGAELRRVLRPEGVAVFCEPWGGNPVLEMVRRFIPYPGKHRTPGERPLRSTDLQRLGESFPKCRCRGFEFIGMVRRLFRRQPRAGGWLEALDTRLLRRWPILENWTRYVVLHFENR